MKNRIPVSGIIIPLIYFLSGIVLIFNNVKLHELYLNTIPIFDFSYFIISIGCWCIFYSIILRRLFVKHQEVYLDFLMVFALIEFVWMLANVYMFYEFRTQFYAYSIVFNFSFFYLFMYERRIFRK
jgi:hypothetical protein